jgi:hypothetical protein
VTHACGAAQQARWPIDRGKWEGQTEDRRHSCRDKKVSQQHEAKLQHYCIGSRFKSASDDWSCAGHMRDSHNQQREQKDCHVLDHAEQQGQSQEPQVPPAESHGSLPARLFLLDCRAVGCHSDRRIAEQQNNDLDESRCIRSCRRQRPRHSVRTSKADRGDIQCISQRADAASPHCGLDGVYDEVLERLAIATHDRGDDGELTSADRARARAGLHGRRVVTAQSNTR